MFIRLHLLCNLANLKQGCISYVGCRVAVVMLCFRYGACLSTTCLFIFQSNSLSYAHAIKSKTTTQREQNSKTKKVIEFLDQFPFFSTIGWMLLEIVFRASDWPPPCLTVSRKTHMFVCLFVCLSDCLFVCLNTVRSRTRLAQENCNMLSFFRSESLHS